MNLRTKYRALCEENKADMNFIGLGTCKSKIGKIDNGFF